MKKIFYVLICLFFCECDSKINNDVIVERINVIENNDKYKYEVKLKTTEGNVYLYTNFRFQVSDTLISYYQFFEGKNSEINRLAKENDSLKKEINVLNYYLQILKERVIIDTTK